MLNERIERFSEIADSKGLFFVWQSISQGVTSMDSLAQLRSHHSGKLCLNILPTLLLLEEMGYISLEGDNIKIESPFINYDDVFIIRFSDSLVDFLIKEEVISLDSLRYDSQNDCFILARNGIKYKHASYRNLLLSLGVLSKRDDGSFEFERKLDTIIAFALEKNKKTEERLLQELEQQRQEGLAGEIFVIQYELTRLEHHPQKGKIKQISIIDVSAGFDIISFEDASSKILNRFIEVKTYRGKPHFYWSVNEIRVSKLRAEHYYLYLVDFDKVSEPGYEPIIIPNPSEFFIDNEDWNITPDSFLYEHV